MDLSTTQRTDSKEAIQSQTLLLFQRGLDEARAQTNLSTFSPPTFSPARTKHGALRFLPKQRAGSTRPLYGISSSSAPDVPGAGLARRWGSGIRKHLSYSRSCLFSAQGAFFPSGSDVQGVRCLLSRAPGAVWRLPHSGPRPGALS